MYIRIVTQKNKATGEVYITHSLVESYRNALGKVRQQVLLNLGTHFSFPKEQWKELSNRIEEICQSQQTLFSGDALLEAEAQRIAQLLIHKRAIQVNPLSHKNQEIDYQTVDINSLEYQQVKKIGAEHVGLHAARQLQLDVILSHLGFNTKQIHLALGSIIGRLVKPGSELSTHGYLAQHSALDELLETDFSNLSLKYFYQIADQLYKHKDAIEKALYQREVNLFHLDETITLYDMTNTYFEGRCLRNKKAHFGRSKEKRHDCPLVTLGMILDSSGFPKKSEFFPGNIGECKTLQQMLIALGDNKHATIVMDAGIATEENLEWLRMTNRKYIVVSRKRNPVFPENKNPVIVKEEKNNIVQVALVKNDTTNELELYCHSQAKEAKVTQMVSKGTARYEIELQKLVDGLHKKGGIKKLEKIGRLKEKYKKISHLYKISITPDAQQMNAKKISWVRNDEAICSKEAGIYCLRTNQQNLDEKKLWQIYTMLTELEAAFRCLKSELGFRPVFHQKEHRVDGHLFISIIAYHLLHTIRCSLKANGIDARWHTICEILNTQSRVTSTLKLKNGKTVHIRKTTSPDTKQLQIYKALNINTHPGKTEKSYF